MSAPAWADTSAVVVDLGFGDAGKGVTVDLLCARRRYGAVVRANGGAQAAHNVVAPDGRHHTFSQFGAGTLAPDGPVPTHLSRLMVVDPLALAAEGAHLASLSVPDPFGLVTVDERALIATPWHQEANRIRERARGGGRHGSCGMGVGEAMAYALARPGDAPTAGDCRTPAVLRRKLHRLADHLDALRRELGDGSRTSPDVEDCVAAYGGFARRVRIVDESYLPGLLARAPVVFEGAQGVLLDEWHGFHPHTTWSTTTTANPLALLAEAGRPGDARRIGVVRAYTTRHGAGPFPTEDPSLAGLLPEPHNGTHPWQGAFRVGHLDLAAHRYALAATGGVDSLVVTHADSAAAAGGRLRRCTGYTDRAGRPLVPVPGDAPAPSHPLHPAPGPLDARADAHLRRQAALADALAAARPVLADGPTPPEEIADALGTPLEAVFSGPTRDDARITAPA
ncbi:adenylosuccinate synthetase [Nocardiopsis changdeensis]|uniref:Adenylosuccinate synthetase n=1 Tax=Nocardiopsis changdeensis TaxID=2831969 RepID=A0ABX8BGG6_9ACTN|nr:MULTISPECIES: adenylosuccinate synthetase [Nocardiopsis]QUX21330.1 adenylosuccinate synthetase [Nocardiopsis changdeensis]QYX37261.1 adenylosuccinate synthetase [Nocardiopsis sp. MT53]